MSEQTQIREQRALWVVPVGELGGVARHVLDATRVGIPGWHVTVLCPEGALAERLRAQGSAVLTGPFGPAAGTITSMRTLARAARQLRPAIVHSHLAYADIVTAWTKLPRGTRRFTTEHGIAGEDSVYHRSNLQARVMASVHRLRFSRFDGVIAVAHATRDTMVRKWRVAQPITVIHNGVDLPAGAASEGPGAVPAQPDLVAPRYLSLSRLSAEKRIDVLLEAFVAVHKKLPEATLVIAGEGPLLSELEARANKLGAASRITFAGYVDAEAAMANADVIVQLSVWENHSYTLLDAVSRGMRVVASNVGGNPEIVAAGSLVSEVDPATVARAMLARAEFSDQTAQQAQLAAQAGPGVQLYSTPEMCVRIAATYGVSERYNA
ncbi:glycosyltransferase involved in cell wall biosynthesis [Leucobacter exalbidus]|uniref:Glycosyltransferase involved in cell wall biosynthesis n=1 Tax=Leucobacter exalbidus TaxID=662960 RepID=A0A940T3W3_9MICO|nr:glycosyltransferase family 4 protein [Leucobacter exalbidus]MBP1326223.1 glycosyltransferase involved in cell wall biosynthesis [Leucobacter exalbidus]